MKLILYKHNLSPFWRGIVEDQSVSIQHFTFEIRKMAWFANVIEYKNGEFSKILKDKNEIVNSCADIPTPAILPRTIDVGINHITIDLRGAKSITLNY